jgi:hypothetical protein
MANYFFSVAGGGRYNGKHPIKSDVTTLRNGNLVKLDSSGNIILDAGTDKEARGFLYEHRPYAEFPLNDNVAATHAGKMANFVTGEFQAYVGVDHFAVGALPAVGAKLYAGTAGNVGKLAVTGTTPVGECELQTTVPDGVGGTISVALCRFNFFVV